MKTAKFFLRTLIGLVVGSVIGGLSTGSLGDFLAGLAMAVVCTLGLALLVIVPAAYLLGLLLTAWFIPVGATGWTRAPRSKPPDTPLAAYIRAARADGTSEETITRELTEAGWKPEQIHQACTTLPPHRQ